LATQKDFNQFRNNKELKSFSLEVFYAIAPSYPLKNPLTPPPLCAANACASKHVVRSLHNIYQPSLASATKIKFLGKFKKNKFEKNDNDQCQFVMSAADLDTFVGRRIQENFDSSFSFQTQSRL